MNIYPAEEQIAGPTPARGFPGKRIIRGHTKGIERTDHGPRGDRARRKRQKEKKHDARGKSETKAKHRGV